MEDYQVVTLIIAVFAVTLSGISLLWNILLHVVALPRVEVRATIMQITPTPPGVGEDDSIVTITAVNTRSRQVTIRGFHGVFGNPSDRKMRLFIIGSPELAAFGSRLPCRLREGEEANVLTICRDNGDKLIDLNDPKQIKYFSVVDTCNREWYTRKWPLRKQIEVYKKGRSN